MTDDEINELIHLRDAIDTVLGYISDTSCGDPECCGGPYYSDEEFVIAKDIVENYRGDRLEENEMLREALTQIARLRTDLSGDFSLGSHQSDIARAALGGLGK
jgi:hypothetical protein